MSIRLKRYKREFDHSYTFGVFPTLELLTYRSPDVLQVVAHPKGAANQGMIKIQEICQNGNIPFEFQEKTFTRIGTRENDYAIGVFSKNEPGLDPSANHVILVNPSSMGNLGTIIRTMLGFGFRDLALIEPAADIFSPEVIRASMGALFQLRFARFENFSDYLALHHKNLYLLMTDGKIPLSKATFKPTFGLVFGSESSGLTAEYHQFGTSLHIPQSSAIDSLNLAISVGITLYQAKSNEL